MYVTNTSDAISHFNVSNPCSDKDGHIKLSDFGLSTGFHKQHDSSYYQRLLESGNRSNGPAQSRNSVMVNSINLTMTNKDQIATWKANRRKLVSLFSQVPISYMLNNFNISGILYCGNARLHSP